MRRRFYRISGKIFSRMERFRRKIGESELRARLGSVYPSTVLEYPLEVPNPKAVRIGRGARISWFSALIVESENAGDVVPQIIIGEGSYLGNRCRIVANRKVQIGKNVLIADDVSITDRVSDLEKEGKIREFEVDIGDGSWIGENVCIAGDVRIGRNSVIGANAVVCGDIPSYSVAVGSPVRIVKRFDFARKRWEPTDAEGGFLKDENAPAFEVRSR